MKGKNNEFKKEFLIFQDGNEISITYGGPPHFITRPFSDLMDYLATYCDKDTWIEMAVGEARILVNTRDAHLVDSTLIAFFEACLRYDEGSHNTKPVLENPVFLDVLERFEAKK